MWKNIYSIILLLCEIGIIIAYGRGSEYSTVNWLNLYPVFQDIHVMIFVGFGFLMVFLKRHSWTSVAVNMFVAAWAIQIYILFRFMWESIWEKEEKHVELNITSLITGDFSAGAVLITFGALLGKVSAFQMFILAIIEVFFFSLNEIILYTSIMVTDVGGSMVIHTFGAFFGLSVSLILSPKKSSEAKHLGEGYTNNLIAMVGTLFLWLYWPSFNCALAGNAAGQGRAIINTYLCLTGSVLGTFMISGIANHEKKFRMEDVLNATLAGGVCIGASCDVIINAWVSIAVGFGIGIISCLGFNFVTPKLNKSLHDTCGVLNLHGIPGAVGCIVSAIIVAATNAEKFPDLNGYIRNGRLRNLDRTNSQQGGQQIIGGLITLGIAIGSGFITGFILKLFNTPNGENQFNDEAHFETKPEFFALPQVETKAENKPHPLPQQPINQNQIKVEFDQCVIEDEHACVHVNQQPVTKLMNQSQNKPPVQNFQQNEPLNQQKQQQAFFQQQQYQQGSQMQQPTFQQQQNPSQNQTNFNPLPNQMTSAQQMPNQNAPNTQPFNYNPKPNENKQPENQPLLLNQANKQPEPQGWQQNQANKQPEPQGWQQNQANKQPEPQGQQQNKQPDNQTNFQMQQKPIPQQAEMQFMKK